VIINKEEQEDLKELLDKVQEFIESTKKEKTIVGMKLYEKCHDWLIKIGG